MRPDRRPRTAAEYGDFGVAPDQQLPEFEQALAELEAVVERLERGDLPLEEALSVFERGVELTRHCQSALKAAQQRVEILTKRDGQPQIESFTADGRDGTAA
jgi:exodeoxyribonuclease VII small subunit